MEIIHNWHEQGQMIVSKWRTGSLSEVYLLRFINNFSHIWTEYLKIADDSCGKTYSVSHF